MYSLSVAFYSYPASENEHWRHELQIQFKEDSEIDWDDEELMSRNFTAIAICGIQVLYFSEILWFLNLFFPGISKRLLLF